MNQEKIGIFIAESRKKKNLTQVELAEKLGVSDRSVSKWETGRCMPDLSLFEPLCAELGITVSELLNGEVLSRELFSGEKIKTEEYQKELEKNTSDIIGYSQKQIENQKRKISYFIMAAGVLVSLSAFIVFSPESSWSSVYSIIGILIFTAGLFRELKIKNRIKKAGICALAFLVALTVFYAVDFFSVASFHRPPIYRYTTATEFGESKLITYDSLLYKVYMVNADTQNEYYIIDTRREYSSDTIPLTPFDREKSGIDNIIKYKNKYIGDNSNTGNLIHDLPLSEYGCVFEINGGSGAGGAGGSSDSEDSIIGLTIDYSTTDWYYNENQYVNRAMLYNAVSIFMLIDNVDHITFNFSGSAYKAERTAIENNYPGYFDVLQDGAIDKDKFNGYVEEKMNDGDFAEEMFSQCFSSL